MRQNELIPIRQFVDNQLPQLVQNPLTALFSTYREVSGYENGSVETGKKGLKVIVQNGRMAFDPFDLAGLMIGNIFPEHPEARKIGDVALESCEYRAGSAQERVERVLALKKDDNMLAVIYAGVSGFEKATDFAVRLKQENPKTIIVVLTCDCNPSWKEESLLPLVEAGEIDYALVTGECGGRRAMKSILEKLVSIWPNN